MVNVAFIHPDMGIGGAEQLIVNLAMLCKNNGWNVSIYTPFFDKNRSFDQLKDGTLSVKVIGNWFPRRIFGRCQALCEYIRFFIASLYLILFGRNIDIVVVDQITISLPLLCLRFKTFFYCHYPDKLLCVDRKGLFKKIYRLAIDYLEEICLLFAGMVVVNSNYTKSVFKENFKIYCKLRSLPEVLYPCSDLSNFDKYDSNKKDLFSIKGMERLEKVITDKKIDINNCKFIVTLNRYERKKNLPLAADAFIEFTNLVKDKENYFFINAGGYDERLEENYGVYIELKNKNYPIQNNVFLLKSISNEERCILLKNADVVLYTPKNEHFGIVPCESIYCGSAVIAHKSGGPLESISEEVGFLIDNENPKEWGNIIFKYLSGKKIDKEILKNHIINNFSLLRMNKDFKTHLISRWPKLTLKLENNNQNIDLSKEKKKS